ncbi:MAG: outer membrane beta-barrel protein [Verrucomicrobiota bacterium]
MRTFLYLLTAMGIFALGTRAGAQGLVGIQNYSGDFLTDEPLTWSITTRGGYDHLDYSVPGFDSFETFYVQGGIGATYTEADQTTPWSFAVDLGAIHYLDDIERYDSTFYNARVAFNIAHQVSQRLKISNNFYLTYEAQPNMALGGTTTLFNGQYLYGFNNFNVSYAWSQRFSTTTSYTVDGIMYEDEITSDSEDRLSQLIAQQFSYALTKRTSLTAEYRFKNVTYQSAKGRDYQSHFALAGVDHAWSQRFTGSFRAGAEFMRSERTNQTAPYAEVALNYAVARKTQARWFGALGFDGAELSTFESRYSLRTGVNVSHQLNKRVGLHTGLQYAYSDFDGGSITRDVTEHSLLLSAGVSYNFTENLALDANYTYSILSSDDSNREYQRNNVSLGLTASF